MSSAVLLLSARDGVAGASGACRSLGRRKWPRCWKSFHKRGRSTGTYAKGEINRDQLLNLMAGGKELVDLEQELAKSAKNGTA